MDILLTDTQIYLLRALCGLSGKCKNKDGSLTPDNTWEKDALDRLAAHGFATYDILENSFSVTEKGRNKYKKYGGNFGGAQGTYWDSW